MTNEGIDPTTNDERIIGSLSELDGRGVIRMVEIIATDIDDVWSAITEPARLARWIGEVAGDLRVGGQFTAKYVSGWEGTNTIEVCDAPHRLVVSFIEDDGYKTFTEARLATEGDKTRLVIEDRGLPLGDICYHGAGWQVHVEDLVAHIEDRPASDWRTRWIELLPTYKGMAQTAGYLPAD